jgi:hypothetical protein
MKPIRSDSQEVSHCIASAGACAIRNWYTLGFACAISVFALLITLGVSLIVSVREVAWLGVPFFLILHAFLFWRGRSRRMNWVLAACAGRVFVRLFGERRKGQPDTQEPDVIMFEASEIASMSARTLEVFLYGPEPKLLEWLVIEPIQPVVKRLSDHEPLRGMRTPDLGMRVQWIDEEARLAIGWKKCHPALPMFLQRVVRECPSIVIAHKQRSELDLNGIWHGLSMNFDAQQRQMIVQAKRLGFGRRLAWLLGMYKSISPQQAAAYLNELEQEEAGVSGMTEACEQEAAKMSAGGEQVSVWICALLIAGAMAYFSLRVAESLMAFSYASMGMCGVYAALAGTLILFGFYAPAYWVHFRNQAAKAETFMPGTGFANDAFSYLPSLLLLILAAAGSAHLGRFHMPLQTLPLQIILLASCVQGLLLPPILLYQTAWRKIETGSFFTPRSECACGTKPASPWQGISMKRKILMTAASLLSAVLFTSQVILLVYLRNSPLGKSWWVIADLYYFGIGWWYLACSSVWQIFTQSESIGA